MTRTRALCCCQQTDVNNGPCFEWAQYCLDFPVTVTVTFSGSYTFEQVDTCTGTEIVTSRYVITYSGTLTGSAQTPDIFQGPYGGSGINLCGTATALYKQADWVNEYNGTNCGQWNQCSNIEQTFGTCSTITIGTTCSAGIGCLGPRPDGNRWQIQAEFYGNGVYSIVTNPACCSGSCPPYSEPMSVGIMIGGTLAPGCSAAQCPAETSLYCNCPVENCLSVQLVRQSIGWQGPFRIQNATYYDPDFQQRHIFTGSVTVAFT
jgi:hypothetical protein